jgi:hypothetical protein
MAPGSAETPTRTLWMRAGRECMQAGDWETAIRAYGQGLWEQPLLGMHYAANLERAQGRYRRQRQEINAKGPASTTVAVVGSQLGSNAAGRAFTLAQLYRHLGHPVSQLGSHFPDQGRELWEPIRGEVRQQGVAVHSVVVEEEPAFAGQAWQLVLQQPADLVHLSKPRLPAVVFGLLFKRLSHGLPEARELMGLLWTRLAVDLAQRFDGTFGVTPLAAARV